MLKRHKVADRRMQRTTMALLCCCIGTGCPDENTAPTDGGAAEQCEARSAVDCESELRDALSLQEGNPNLGSILNTRGSSGFLSEVDARSGGVIADPRQSYLYAHFTEDGLELLDLDDAAALTSTDWDIAFHRYIVRLNGGTNGPSCVRAAKVDGRYTDVDEDTLVPSMQSDSQWTDTCAFRADAEAGDPANERDFGNVLRDYYTYEGCLRMSGQVFVLDLGDGRRVKWTMTHYYDEAGQQECNTGAGTSGTGAGRLQMQWSFVQGGATAPDAGMVTLDGGVDAGPVEPYNGPAIFRTQNDDGSFVSRIYAPPSAPVHFSFTDMFPVEAADFSTSTDWDLLFDSFNIFGNGGAAGPGTVSFTITDKAFADVTLEDVAEAPLVALEDSNADGKPESVMSHQHPWFDYDASTHILHPNETVYIVKSNSDNFYKVEVVDFYLDDDTEQNHFPAIYWQALGTMNGAEP